MASLFPFFFLIIPLSLTSSLSPIQAATLPSTLQRVLPALVDKCVPTTTTSSTPTVYFESEKTQCPCFLQFKVHSLRNTDPSTLDLMLFTEENYQAYKATDFTDRSPSFESSSVLNAQAGTSFDSSTGVYTSEGEQIDLNDTGEYRVVVRGTSGLSTKDCETQPEITFESRPRQCKSLLENRIVGGQDVTLDALRNVMVSFSNGRGKCTGSLIAEQWVLTAAHCGVSTVGSVFVGGDLIETGTEYDVEDAITHESYRTGRQIGINDIALIKLKTAVTLDGKPIGLNRNGDVDSGNARVAGYGTISSGWRESGNLLQVDVPIIPHTECVTTLRSSSIEGARTLSNTLNRDVQLCASAREGGCDSCQGDSGGPLVQQSTSTGALYQTGVISGGINCGLPNAPGIYTRISSYVDWIQDNTRDAATLVDGDVQESSLDNGSSLEEKSKKGIIIGVTVGVGVVVIIGLLLAAVIIWKKRGNSTARSDNPTLPPSDSSPGTATRDDIEAPSAIPSPSNENDSQSDSQTITRKTLAKAPIPLPPPPGSALAPPTTTTRPIPQASQAGSQPAPISPGPVLAPPTNTPIILVPERPAPPPPPIIRPPPTNPDYVSFRAQDPPQQPPPQQIYPVVQGPEVAVPPSPPPPFSPGAGDGPPLQ